MIETYCKEKNIEIMEWKDRAIGASLIKTKLPWEDDLKFKLLSEIPYQSQYDDFISFIHHLAYNQPKKSCIGLVIDLPDTVLNLSSTYIDREKFKNELLLFNKISKIPLIFIVSYPCDSSHEIDQHISKVFMLNPINYNSKSNPQDISFVNVREVTDKRIEKVLKHIVEKERKHISKELIAEIVEYSSGDLRKAIIQLEFYCNVLLLLKLYFFLVYNT